MGRTAAKKESLRVKLTGVDAREVERRQPVHTRIGRGVLPRRQARGGAATGPHPDRWAIQGNVRRDLVRYQTARRELPAGTPRKKEKIAWNRMVRSGQGRNAGHDQAGKRQQPEKGDQRSARQWGSKYICKPKTHKQRMAAQKAAKYRDVRTNGQQKHARINPKLGNIRAVISSNLDKKQKVEEGKMWQFALRHYGDFSELKAGRKDLNLQRKVFNRERKEMEDVKKEMDIRDQKSKSREEESRKLVEKNRLQEETNLRREERTKRRLKDADESVARNNEQGRRDAARVKEKEDKQADMDKRQDVRGKEQDKKQKLLDAEQERLKSALEEAAQEKRLALELQNALKSMKKRIDEGEARSYMPLRKSRERSHERSRDRSRVRSRDQSRDVSRRPPRLPTQKKR